MAESTGPAAPAPRSLFLRLPSALRVAAPVVTKRLSALESGDAAA